MNRHRRILVELIAPPLLAAVALAAKSNEEETFTNILLGFVPLVGFCYVLGLIPSLLYTGAMELWFRAGLRGRLGLLGTVLLSACLGAGAGFAAAVLGTGFGFSASDRLYFLRLGTAIGLLIGFYVGREQTRTAQPEH